MVSNRDVHRKNFFFVRGRGVGGDLNKLKQSLAQMSTVLFGGGKSRTFRDINFSKVRILPILVSNQA